MSDSAQVQVIEPGLVLTKTASAAVVRADDDVTYTVAVTNTGDVGLRLIGPVDLKCPTLTLASGDTNNNDLLDGANSGARRRGTTPVPARFRCQQHRSSSTSTRRPCSVSIRSATCTRPRTPNRCE